MEQYGTDEHVQKIMLKVPVVYVAPPWGRPESSVGNSAEPAEGQGTDVSFGESPGQLERPGTGFPVSPTCATMSHNPEHTVFPLPSFFTL